MDRMITITHKPWFGVLVVSACLLTACTTAPRPREAVAPSIARDARHRCRACGVVLDVRQVPMHDAGIVIGAAADQASVGIDPRATVARRLAGDTKEPQSAASDGAESWQALVRLDDGRYATIVQRDDPHLRNGDYVEVRAEHVYPR
jgi:outer membrane lipoprotein SlyB